MKTRDVSVIRVGMWICLVVFLMASSFAGQAQAAAPQVAAGVGHTVGLKSDGTAVWAGLQNSPVSSRYTAMFDV